MVKYCDLIIEGLLTTWDKRGCVNLSPMGARFDNSETNIQLRPFITSRSYQNLMNSQAAVFHITDDVELIAHSAIGELPEMPELIQLNGGFATRLKDTCRWFFAQLSSTELIGERSTLHLKVMQTQTVRNFCGFNRAKHAVIEAAILATRVGILPDKQILDELVCLEPWVEKTGGRSERDAFSMLSRWVRNRMLANETSV